MSKCFKCGTRWPFDERGLCRQCLADAPEPQQVDPIAVWVTTPPEVTELVDVVLAADVGRTCPAARTVIDVLPMLYNSTVVVFFAPPVVPDAFPESEICQIFVSHDVRVHNVIAIASPSQIRFRSSAGEQDLRQHELILETLLEQHAALVATPLPRQQSLSDAGRHGKRP
jgi:hypothetical protein